MFGQSQTNTTCSTLVPGIILIATLRGPLKTPRYDPPLIPCAVNVCLFGLVSQQFYAYWIIGMWSFFYFFTSNDGSVGRLQRHITFEVCTTILYFPALTFLHRLFVVAQFVFVAFQSLLFVLTPISWREVYSVHPSGYQPVAYGVEGIVSFLPSPQLKLAIRYSSVL